MGANPELKPATSGERRYTLLDVPIDFVSPLEAVSEIISWRNEGRNGYVCFANPYSLISCGRDPDFRDAILKSTLIVPDGVGLTIGARLLGYGRTQRVPGPSLMLELCDKGRDVNLRHFFYGGGPEVTPELCRRLVRRFPGLRVAGWYSPPFRDLTLEEDRHCIAQINETQPDVIWVGLGTGKQEKWMASHLDHVQASCLLGVGAAFDFHSGRIPWAPSWVRKTGMEWAYRLAQEPGRLWRRNLDGAVFLGRILVKRI